MLARPLSVTLVEYRFRYWSSARPFRDSTPASPTPVFSRCRRRRFLKPASDFRPASVTLVFARFSHTSCSLTPFRDSSAASSIFAPARLKLTLSRLVFAARGIAPPPSALIFWTAAASAGGAVGSCSSCVAARATVDSSARVHARVFMPPPLYTGLSLQYALHREPGERRLEFSLT